MEKTIAMILAVDERNGLGKDNTLAWKLSGDMKYFRELTTTTLSSTKQNAVVMGRKTWESIPEKFRPLPQRHNCVISRLQEEKQGTNIYSSLERALSSLQNDDTIESIYIIGGGQIYNEAIKKDLVDTIYLTQVLGDFGCDVFFTGIPDNYDLVSMSEMQEEKGIRFQFCVYEKTREIKPLTNGKTLWEGEAPSIVKVED